MDDNQLGNLFGDLHNDNAPGEQLQIDPAGRQGAPELTSTEELEIIAEAENIGRQDIIVVLKVIRIDAVKAVGTNNHKICLIIGENDTGSKIGIKAWRNEAERLQRETQLGHVVRFSFVKSCEVSPKFNNGTISCELTVGPASTIEDLGRLIAPIQNIQTIDLNEVAIHQGKLSVEAYIKVVPRQIGNFYIGTVVQGGTSASVKMFTPVANLEVGTGVTVVGVFQAPEILAETLTSNRQRINQDDP